MADLRGGSTVGGKPIVTIDMINQLVGFKATDYVTTLAPRLTDNYDLNTVLTTGFYRCYQATNRPALIAGWAYIEVIRHDDNWILQKIYSYEGLYSFFRTKQNGTWQVWRSLSDINLKVNVNSSSWTLDSSVNLYTCTLTHNFQTQDIDVSMRATATNNSVFPAFSAIDINTVKIFCESALDARVIVTAI